MRLDVTHIRIQGFRSFTESQIFYFRNKPPGVYFLTGKNMHNPKLGGNATGKSTLWEALTWCFFGKTSRNLRADNIVNWDGEYPCEVTVGLKIDNSIEYSIKRTQAPNSLKCRIRGEGWEVMTEGQLFALLQLTHDSFLYSVIASQTKPTFIDLSSTDKAKVFSSVMNVDVWLRYSKSAAIKAGEYKDEISMFRERLAKIEGQLEILKSENHEASHRKWESDRKQRLLESEKKLYELKESIKGLKHYLRENRHELISCKNVLEKNIVKVDKVVDEKESCSYRRNKLLQIISDANRSIKSEEGFQLNLTNDKGTCRRCNQKISRDHIKKELRDSDDKVREYKNLLKKADIALEIEDSKDKRIDRDHADLKQRIDDLNKRISRLKVTITRSKSDISARKREEASRESACEEIEREISPYSTQLVSAADKRSLLVVKQMAASGKIKKLAKAEENAKYWIKGFKEVRFSLMTELLKGLEIETNNALTSLGLEEWELMYAMEELTKKGTERKGFFVDVISPDVDKSVPWEVWSGGESQRLRLAASMGLSNFIHYQLGLEWNIEVWDEPSNWLSEEGIKSMLTLLHHRALSEGKQVWIVDHRSLDYGLFMQRYTVVKDQQGSFIMEDK